MKSGEFQDLILQLKGEIQTAEQEAKVKAEQEARGKEEREKAEAAENARQDALKPDIEKLSIWAGQILEITAPELTERKSRELASDTLSEIYRVGRELQKNIGGL